MICRDHLLRLQFKARLSCRPLFRLMACWPLLLLGLGGVSGCYDGNALLKQAEAAALSTTLAEVDLGTFQTTLPRDANTGVFTTVELHVFGTVPRAKLSEVKTQLQVDEYRLRHDTLVAVRQSTRDELTDPELAKLRARIINVVNKILANSPAKEIGFYQITVR